MLFGGIDARRRAEGALGHRHIGALVFATRHIIGRKIGKNCQQITHFLFKVALFLLALLDGVLQARHVRHKDGSQRLILLRLGLADQLGFLVALRLLGLQPHQHVAQGAVLFQDLVRDRTRIRGISRPPRQLLCESVAIFANSLYVEHHKSPVSRSCHGPCAGSKSAQYCQKTGLWP